MFDVAGAMALLKATLRKIVQPQQKPYALVTGTAGVARTIVRFTVPKISFILNARRSEAMQSARPIEAEKRRSAAQGAMDKVTRGKASTEPKSHKSRFRQLRLSGRSVNRETRRAKLTLFETEQELGVRAGQCSKANAMRAATKSGSAAPLCAAPEVGIVSLKFLAKILTYRRTYCKSSDA
jgi:hypothetical protein